MHTKKLRTRAIEVAREMAAPGEGVDRRYLEFIAPGEEPAAAREMAAMESAGLVIAGLYRAIGVSSPRLDPPYVLGTSIQRLVDIAGDAGAFMPFEEGRYPLPGDVVILAGDHGGLDHAYMVTSITESEKVTLESVESGERSAHRHGLVAVKKRQWEGNLDIVHEAGHHDKHDKIAREIVGFIDLGRLPRSAGADVDEVFIPVSFDDQTKRLPPDVTQVTAPEMVAAMEKAWTARFGAAPLRESIYVLVAQWALETGWGKAMHAYNVGNIKGVEGDGRDYTYFACDEYIKGKQIWIYPDSAGCRFRAYETLDLGVADYLETLHERYHNTWDAVLAGDPVAFAQHLKAAHYFTGDEQQYAQGLSSISRSLARTAAPVGPAGLDLHSTLGIQKALKELGYDPGTADGRPGPRTTAALTAFQRANGLMADGIIGSATREVMAAKLSSPAATPTPTEEPTPPASTPCTSELSAEQRGSSVYHAARFELARGVARHGKGMPWAVNPNSGPIVDEYQRAAGILDAAGNWGIPENEAHWCGNFCGFNYRKAGFDMDGKLEGRLNAAGGAPGVKKLIFWSTVRLDHYWKHREGSTRLEFPYQNTSMSREECIAWLEEHFHPFAPRAGDVLLVTTIRPMAHVAMVASYTPETYELVTYEGNFSRRAAAVRWDLAEPGIKGFHRINVIGRFPEADFVKDPEVAWDADSPEPEIEGAQVVSGRHDDAGVEAKS